jgi:RHS repeat-associated protein
VAAAEGSGGTTISDALRTDAYGQTIGLYPAGGSELPVRFRGLVDLAPTADRDVAGAGSDALYAMGARLYSPHLGGFTSLDTYAGRAQDPASLNRYLYAHANPATLIDPDGHKVCEFDSCGVGQNDQPDPGSTYKPPRPPNSPDPKEQTPAPTTTSTGNPNAGGGNPPQDFFGNVGARIGALATVGWDVGTGLVVGVFDLAQCAVPIPGFEGCSPAQLTRSLIENPRGTVAAMARVAAQGIGETRADLLSGDPYRETRAAGSVVVAAAGLLALGKGVVDVARKARLATRAARDAKLAEEAPAGVPQPAQLAAGMKEELRSLAALGVEKNTAIWRPDKAMMASTLFRVVVGNPKFTMKGRPVGTIIDAAGLEIKAGTSPLEASYQLRLQVYRSIVTGDSLTILTSRPLTGSFSRYLDRWGVTVGDLP